MRRRDEAAFEAFVGTRGRALLRTAHLLVGDVGLAEDLVQTTFERVARRWGSLDGDVEGYARRTLANLAVDGWRRRGARPAERLGEVPERPNTGAGAGQVDDRLDLVAALLTLTARQRTVLVLRYFEDLSEAETAATLGITVGTVKSTAARALAQLRATHETTTITSNGSIG